MTTRERRGVQSSERRNYALRLTFAYEGDDLRLVKRQRLEMIAPPPDPTTGYEGQSGFWFELQDVAGRVLYRRVLHQPIQYDVEIYPADPALPLTRRRLDEPRGIFVLLAPDLEQARTLVICGSPRDPEMAHLPAAEIARFDLRQQTVSKEAAA